MTPPAVNPPANSWTRGPVGGRQSVTAPRPFERPAPEAAAPGAASATTPVRRPGSPVPDTAVQAPAARKADPPTSSAQDGSPTSVLALPPSLRDVPPPTGPASPARAAGISWVGAHGGAGATTFAEALGGTDIGHAWPEVAEGEPGDVLLLARTHLAGLQAASKALDSLRTGRHPQGIRLVALVLVADAPGRLPPELWRRVRVLRAVVRTFSVPWIPQWRVGKPAPKAPRSVVELAALIPAPPETGSPR
ncbi:DUF6668 family protein [[Kitasatospora] papulosa]|uniref:DUF6668 family protein n=1 Tax=[Kitasatospora] papulosa TaxID=1464011 RepID=UPI00369043AE